MTSPYACANYIKFVYDSWEAAVIKELLTRLIVCSLCIMSICNLSYFPFWFQRRDIGLDFGEEV